MLKKYPSPSNDPTYKRYWDILLPELLNREKFMASHILMLETVCELYVQEKTLKDVCDLAGYTYDAGEGRAGISKRPTPEAQLLFQTRNQIAAFLKALGFYVKDPKSVSGAPAEVADEWG